MTAKQYSILVLLLFTQAVFYPAVIFFCFAEKGSHEVLELPANFPDNGTAFYFGFNNNEEETIGEQVINLFQEVEHEMPFVDPDSSKRSRFGFFSNHINIHREIVTPPPEVI